MRQFAARSGQGLHSGGSVAHHGDESIAIKPGLPAARAAGLCRCDHGHGEKVALGFDRKVFDGIEIPFADIFDPVAPETRPLNFELHPFGRPIAVAHVGGSVAGSLQRRGPKR